MRLFGRCLRRLLLRRLQLEPLLLLEGLGRGERAHQLALPRAPETKERPIRPARFAWYTRNTPIKKQISNL